MQPWSEMQVIPYCFVKIDITVKDVPPKLPTCINKVLLVLYLSKNIHNHIYYKKFVILVLHL